jgi:hypothetical protein
VVTAARSAAEQAFAAGAASVARLRYEKGEHYLLTRPGAGAWSFQRQWPSGVAFRAETPEGVAVTADGRLALMQLTIDTAQNRVHLVAPQYLHDTLAPGQKFEEKASALLIFGAKDTPAVELNGKPYSGSIPAAEIAGDKAFVVPLYGAKAEDVLNGLAERCAAAMSKLPQ